MMGIGGYGSVEERPAVIVFTGELSATPTGDPESSRANAAKSALVAFTLIGGTLTLASSWGSRSEATATAGALDVLGAQPSLALPSYLDALDETDPEWDEHSWMLASGLVVGAPGKGNLVPDRTDIVRFTEPHFVFRTYSEDEHKASRCGYWWTLEPPNESIDTYFDHFAICPEWNDATKIIRCRVPEGYIGAVGEGQSVNCPESGKALFPDSKNLQLNGDICTAAAQRGGGRGREKHLACSYCTSNAFDLELSACLKIGPNYIYGFTFSKPIDPSLIVLECSCTM